MLKIREIEPLKGKARLKVWLLGLSSGVLMTLCQPPADIPLLGLVALAPLFMALPRTSPWGSWLMGFGVGLPYFGINVWWLSQMVTDPGNEWIIFAMYSFIVFWMSVFFGFAAQQIRWLLTRRVTWTVWLVPFAWLGWEFLHEFNTPAPYPWLPLGLSLADFTMFAQIADIWGQYGLTVACAFFALGVASPFALEGESAKFTRLKDQLHRYVLPGSAVAMLIAGCIYGMIRINIVTNNEAGDGPLIGCVQGNLPQEVKVSNDPERVPNSFREHLRLTEEATILGADLVAWPETMLFGGATREGLNYYTPNRSAQFFNDGVPDRALLDGTVYGTSGDPYRVSYAEFLRAKVAHEYKTPLLVGVLTPIPPEEQIHEWKKGTYDRRKYNTAMLIDEQGRVADTYDKRYLVPGGEYIPLEGFGPVRAIIEGYSQGLQGYTSRVEPGMRLTTFRSTAEAERLNGRDWAFTSSICYEYAWPICYIELHDRKERYPDFHVNISNEGWFKRSAELDQAVDYCRIRAIESRVPMIRATNTGISCNIDAAGRIVETFTVGGDDREVGGLFLTRPAVLKDPVASMFVVLVGRLLGWISLLVVVGILVKMIVGRVQAYNRRRRAKLAEQVAQGSRPASTPAVSGNKS